jgi:UDP-2,3-diacylglucosamine hydrolase
MAQAMRAQSEAHNQSMASFADADAALTRDWLQAAGSLHLVHGHTHRPADHRVEGFAQAQRQVLSDWHVTAAQHRAQVLRLHADGRSERLPA